MSNCIEMDADEIATGIWDNWDDVQELALKWLKLRQENERLRAALTEAQTCVDHTKSATEGAGCVYTCVACIITAALESARCG